MEGGVFAGLGASWGFAELSGISRGWGGGLARFRGDGGGARKARGVFAVGFAGIGGEGGPVAIGTRGARRVSRLFAWLGVSQGSKGAKTGQRTFTAAETS